jgi:putative phosphoribosyl transferase
MQPRPRVFADRVEAGRELAAAVVRLQLTPPVVVLGLPRGGVPVACEVARALHAPLDVLAVRKVGMPWQPELAIGAIATGNVTVRQPLGESFGPDAKAFEALAERERHELERREQLYRPGRGPLDLTGRTAVIVDDGLATGATMLAAVRAAHKAGAAAVIVAVPVASHEATALLRPECRQVVAVLTPPHLFAVGEWYADFPQVEDAEVCRLLASSAPAAPEGATAPPG